MPTLGVSVLTILVVTLILVAAALYLVSKLLKFQAHLLFVIITGLILGLVIGALASVPLSRLPDPYGEWLPVIVTAVITGVTATIFVRREAGFTRFFRSLPHLFVTLSNLRTGVQSAGSEGRRILVDTSVIVDGRIYDIAKTGFIPGKLVVPRFVIKELQTIADSDNDMKRARGGRGLEVLTRLKKELKLEVSGEDVPEAGDVDSKLIQLAVRTGAEILTTDYNLNRIATVEGVRVLNLNELSGALRAVVLPGEELTIQIIQPGKERKQGVGYLPDGTMVVVEGGADFVGQEVTVAVTRSLQTVAGKMIFAALRQEARNKKQETVGRKQ